MPQRELYKQSSRIRKKDDKLIVAFKTALASQSSTWPRHPVQAPTGSSKALLAAPDCRRHWTLAVMISIQSTRQSRR